MPQSTKKTVKEAKLYSSKKLPRLLKKKYTEKKLNKKILKKIYIPADKTFITNLFTDAGTNKKGVPLLAVSAERTFTKKEIKQAKKLIKEIKKQKGRIRLVPLIATVSFIFILVTGFLLTKNIIAKKVIKSAVESITQARCDIEKVDIKILDSSFKVKGFQVANKNSPMKNLFSLSEVTIDFDLLQLLKKRFVADEFSVIGIEIASDRTYDGTLPPKKVKKQKEKAKKEESALVKELKQKSQNSITNVQKTLESTFAQYNPETMFSNFYGNLQTPEMAEKVQKEIEAIINNYSNISNTIAEETERGQKIVSSITSINYNEILQNPIEIKSPVDINDLIALQKLQDPEELKKPENIKKIIEISNALNIKKPEDIKNIIQIIPSEPTQKMLNQLNESYNNAMEIKKQAETYAQMIQNDFNKTVALTNDVTKTISDDTNYVQNEINKITSFTAQDGMNFISETMNSIIYSALGKYYPYVMQASDYLMDMKKNKKEKKPKKPSVSVHRSTGRNIYYKNDKTPELWIKKIKASGTGFEAYILNITNNMDIIAKPTTGHISLKIFEQTHTADVTVDTRTNTDNPLVTTTYDCDRIPISLPASYFNNTPGVPVIDSADMNIQASLKILNSQEFIINGTSNFSDLKLNTTPFEPTFISEIYTNILKDMTEMYLSLTSGFTINNGFRMELISNIDKIFMSALEKEMYRQLEILKSQAIEMVLAKINELTNGMFGEINSLQDIQNKVNESLAYINNVTEQITNKKSEMEQLLQKTIAETQKQFVDILDSGRQQLQNELDQQRKAAEDAARQKAKEAEEEFKRKAAEEARNQLKKLF